MAWYNEDTAVLQVAGRGSEFDAAMTQLNLSARAYRQILKLARTIADLAGSEEIQSVHLAEVLHASRPSEVEVGVSYV